MPLRNYLAAIAIFVQRGQGQVARWRSPAIWTCQYKTAFVLAHKLREAMASEMKGMQLGGDGETVEVDGGYFGGYVKPANHKENRRDRRLAKNQNGKRQVVVVVRERGGRTLPAVFKSESRRAGLGSRRRVATGTRLMADEAAVMERPARPLRRGADRPQASSTADRAASTRTAPKSSSPACAAPRSAIITTSPGAYLVRYAQESAWREDHRRVDNGRAGSRRGWAGDGCAGRRWTGAGIGSGHLSVKNCCFAPGYDIVAAVTQPP